MVGLRESTEHGDHRPVGELGILIRFDHEALDHFCVSLNHGGFLVNAQKELKRATTPVEATPFGVREIRLFDHTVEPIGRLFQFPCPNMHARPMPKTEREVTGQNTKQALDHCLFESDIEVCCRQLQVFGLKECPESLSLPTNKKRQAQKVSVPL